MEKSFRERLEAQPDQDVDAIVTAAGSVDELVDALPPGLRIRRRFKLAKGLAVTGPGRRLLAAADLAEVRSVEPDRDVKAQDS